MIPVQVISANRIQSQLGMSLPQLMVFYSTEEKSEAALE